MAIKRKRKTTKRKAASKTYRQAMLAEGAPALNFLGLGDTLDSVFGRRKRKTTAKRRATTKTRAKAKTSRRRKVVSLAKTARRRKTTRRARRA